MRHDPMLAILTDLMRRVEGLAIQRGHMSVPRLQDELDQIRHIARAFHLDTVEGLAGTLESALSLHGLGPIVLSYLDLMRDAIAQEATGAVVVPFVPRMPAAPVNALRA
ncbi:hypothetical protein U5A82_19270 [Sphingobium sp. CR2-8]|uniref:hypothetical protein n=1 Tax=Sphingobium sp. CR2-8 TaxID=1306534 RepID=UPI002DB90285|nr:hypothetical protein [Sphingobium sp. CR2-8]MEC3912533.1 hypothetical protein [Sphingobium sp. CR2-8]